MARVRGLARRTGIRTGEIRLALLSGLLLGLVYFQAADRWTPGRSETPSRIGPAEVPDPWAESRRSSEILRGQEGAPESAYARSAKGGASIPQGGAVRVIDGDTFRYGGETIRIADIDTPETHPARCSHEARLGARATQRLGSLLAEGPFELARIDRDEDRYGRKLRIVTRGGRSLGDVLVSEGLARTWTGRREPWC